MFGTLLHGPTFMDLVVVLGIICAPTFFVGVLVQILVLRRRPVQMPRKQLFGVVLITVLLSLAGTVLLESSPLDPYSRIDPHLFYLPAFCATVVAVSVVTWCAARTRSSPTWAHIVYFGFGGVFSYLVILAYLFLRPPRHVGPALELGLGVAILVGLCTAAFGDRLFQKWFA